MLCASFKNKKTCTCKWGMYVVKLCIGGSFNTEGLNNNNSRTSARRHGKASDFVDFIVEKIQKWEVSNKLLLLYI